MATVHLFKQPDPESDVRVPAPPSDGSAVVVHIDGDGGYDPETNSVQIANDDGSVDLSFGPPEPEQ